MPTKIREYSAVINGTDMIRVKATSERNAALSIAAHCDPGETFVIDGRGWYKVNGRLAANRVTKFKPA